MNIKNILGIILYILILFGIWASTSLAKDQFFFGDICPNLAFIPACYIILGCFIALLTIHISRLRSVYFYSVAILPLSIALYGTLFQIIGGVECPKTSGGIPMCFISLGLFSSIVICKYIISRK